MTASTLVSDRERTALVVVDIQERLAGVMERRETVIARTKLLISAAAIVGAPIIATRQYPKGLGPMEPEITDALQAAADAGTAVHEVDKVSFDCFAEVDFVEAVAATGRTQLVLAGMETHICIAQTALGGLIRGHDVFVAADACCSREEENRHLAIARLAHAGAVISTAESVAYELIGQAGTAEFKLLLAAVKG